MGARVCACVCACDCVCACACACAYACAACVCLFVSDSGDAVHGVHLCMHMPVRVIISFTCVYVSMCVNAYADVCICDSWVESN